MTFPIKQDEVVEVVSNLVAGQSYNPGSDEYDVATYFKSYMEEAGISVETVPISERRFNVIARLKGQGKAAPLSFSGHMDVVPVSETELSKWKTAPFVPTVIDDMLYGRGSADMKGGLGAAMAALKAVKKNGIVPPGDIVVIGTVDEEAVMGGVKALTTCGLLDDIKDMVICEPSDMKLYCCCRGRTWADITLTGESGHASIEGKGNNTINHAATLINAVNNHKFDFPPYEMLGNVFWQVTLIDGGLEPAVVPDTCTVTVDARLVPGSTTNDIWNAMEALLAKLSTENPDFHAKFEVIERREAWETDKSLPLAEMARRGFAKTDIPLEYGAASYTTDGAYFGSVMNMNMVIIGPGDIVNAHRDNEFTPVKQLAQAANVYYDMMVNNTLPLND